MFNRISMLFSIALAFALLFTSCKKDDDEPSGPLVEDGFYIVGEATALSEVTPKGKMSITRNEVIQEDRSSLLDIYVAVKAGSNGFSIQEVAGANTISYGPGSDFAKVSAEEVGAEEPTEGLYKGSFAASDSKFTVDENGLYHVTLDKELKKVAVAKVEWGVIGSATPGKWSTSTQLAEGTFDLNKITFKGEEIKMSKSEFKFRYSNGWKIVLDSTLQLEGSDKGVKVNTNYGGSITELVPGGDNIIMDPSGYYTIEMKWDLNNGTSASFTKTADIQIKDWSNISFDVFGTGVDDTDPNAVVDASSWGWGYAISAGTPTVDGSVTEGAKFTYTWTGIKLKKADGDGFGLRSVEGGEYNGSVLRYSALDEANSSGVSVTTNGFGDNNMNVDSDGLYDVTLVIDAADDDKATVTVVPSI